VDAVTEDLTSRKPMSGLLDGRIKLDEYKKFLGIDKEDFEERVATKRKPLGCC